MQTVWGFYDKFFANDKDLTDALYKLSEKRGPENEEMTGEITGLAGSFVALHGLHCMHIMVHRLRRSLIARGSAVPRFGKLCISLLLVLSSLAAAQLFLVLHGSHCSPL